MAPGTQDSVLSTVAAVLHLGNISFVQSDRDEAELEGSLSQESLAHASELLQVRPLRHLCPKTPGKKP